MTPDDRARIEAALAPLVGLPLWASNRAADLQGFQLGAERVRVARSGPRKGQQRIVGELAIHLQCAWRIAGPNGIIVGSGDLYRPRSDQPETPDWDWMPIGANRRDEAIAAWLADRAYIVAAVQTDDGYGFTLALSEGHTLAVLPNDSSDAEQWRLLPDDEAAPHFVVTGLGIEE